MSIDRGKVHLADLEKIANMLEGAGNIEDGAESLSPQKAAEKLREISSYLETLDTMLEVEKTGRDSREIDVEQDEKAAVHLTYTLMRGIDKWGADERLKKRADRAREWLSRYNIRKPPKILREE